MRPSRLSSWRIGPLVLLILLTAYLTGVHLAGGTVACSTQGFVDCQAVLTGPGSVVLGLPLPAWGMLWGIVGLIGLWHEGRAWLWRLWGLLGFLGLGWAWSHELLDRHLCLWCSGAQGLVVASLMGMISWADAGRNLQRGWHRLRSSWRWMLGTALLGMGSSVGRQLWLGTDRWGWVLVVSLLWGLALGWIVGLAITGRRRSSSVVGMGTVVPVTLAITVGTTACVSGVCSVGASLLAPLAVVGLTGLVNASSLALLPLVFQGVLAALGLIVAGAWTLRQGRAFDR